ncbi:hypothetical protein Tco_0839797 [Tanacetum coccineum]|uniref:Reverse transcriptase domain-containing protein n=1 Tax=Tanacetum coccineum TaxID=301880 RepID=A0ABQ5ARN9_9ASTR
MSGEIVKVLDTDWNDKIVLEEESVKSNIISLIDEGLKHILLVERKPFVVKLISQTDQRTTITMISKESSGGYALEGCRKLVIDYALKPGDTIMFYPKELHMQFNFFRHYPKVQSRGGGGPEGQDDREVTPPSLIKEEIEGQLSALKSIIKDHNKRNKTSSILLDFEEDTAPKDNRIMKGKVVVDDDIRKPFKEALQTPLTRRIIEFAGPEYKGQYQVQTLDGPARGWFERLPAFTSRYSVRRACFKEPHEITKIVRRDNESLMTFKDRWTVERGFIMGVPKVMNISSFMNSLKCPELAKRFSNKAPTTVDKMMMRVDDFVRSKEAFARTELPKGETGEDHRKGRDNRAPYPPLRGESPAQIILVLTLEPLTKPPKEILATETQLHLPPPRPMANPFRGGNIDRYCNYHQEKWHYTNDCMQLKKQLEMALESGKLDHLVKDVRQRGRGNRRDEAPQSAKIINMIRVVPVEEKKRKSREATKEWMNTSITFPSVSSEDVSDELLIVEAEVKRYLVRRVYVDEGVSMEVMFEH